jgi:hypothetical protein
MEISSDVQAWRPAAIIGNTGQPCSTTEADEDGLLDIHRGSAVLAALTASLSGLFAPGAGLLVPRSEAVRAVRE